MEPTRPFILFVQGELMGRGDHDELGRVLIRNFFRALSEADETPDAIIFVNSGVKLVCEGSAVINELRSLAAREVRLLACGTCLDFYGIRERLVAGEASNMREVTAALTTAGRVVSV